MKLTNEILSIIGRSSNSEESSNYEQIMTELSEIDASVISDCFERDARRYSRNISLE